MRIRSAEDMLCSPSLTNTVDMELSKIQRLILFNQHAILAELVKSNSSHHEKMKEVYRSGYVVNYDDDFQHFSDELDRSKSSLVIDVLDMYSAIQRSADQIGGLDSDSYRFPGFDGNNETSYMAYARFVVETEGRFANLKIESFNSHMRSLKAYKRMVDVWNSKGTSGRYNLSEEEIEEVMDARQ